MKQHPYCLHLQMGTMRHRKLNVFPMYPWTSHSPSVGLSFFVYKMTEMTWMIFHISQEVLFQAFTFLVQFISDHQF